MFKIDGLRTCGGHNDRPDIVTRAFRSLIVW
jgi:hypothetical protein